MSDARVRYNSKQAGFLWTIESLPAPLSSLDPSTVDFAEAVTAFQKERGVVADGKLGPKTLGIFSSLPPARTGVEVVDALLSVAFAEEAAKVREVGGENRGPRVEEYLSSLGMPAGSAWCAAFIAWCIMKSRGLSKPPFWCSGSTVTMWQKASRKTSHAESCTPLCDGYRDRVQPGWIMVRARDEEGLAEVRKGNWSLGHCGIVHKVDALGFETFEGNTDAGGSREGEGVYSRRYSWNDKNIARTMIGWFDSSGI